MVVGDSFIIATATAPLLVKDVARLGEAMRGRELSLPQGIPGGTAEEGVSLSSGAPRPGNSMNSPPIFLFFMYLIMHMTVQKGAPSPEVAALFQQPL